MTSIIETTALPAVEATTTKKQAPKGKQQVKKSSKEAYRINNLVGGAHRKAYWVAGMIISGCFNGAAKPGKAFYWMFSSSSLLGHHVSKGNITETKDKAGNCLYKLTKRKEAGGAYDPKHVEAYIHIMKTGEVPKGFKLIPAKGKTCNIQKVKYA